MFLCLFLLWARLSEVLSLSADEWVCIFLLFVVWMWHPAHGDAQGDAGFFIQVVSFVLVVTN